ncbi:MAG: glycosyltransferase [Oscillospiraceae bacterium]|nr:glycosyltransferase [Oscillospiraceae bacterium]
MKIEFSLIVCVYEKEDPLHFAQCIKSILSQTVLPDEWIMVKDGPLGPELDAVLADIRFPKEFKIIALPENVTQGPARAAGVKAASHGLVAVADSDDICLPDRFEKQLEMMNDDPALCLAGGQIAEFSNDPDIAAAARMVPQSHADILRFIKRRNPFNSMTVMFRRDMALKAGNYRRFPCFEDYDLWARMIKNGALCANHPDVLVKARVGAGMYGRRRGLSYIRSEWLMQKQLLDLGFINAAGFAVNAAARIPVRLLPEKGVKAVYDRFARKRFDPAETGK